MNQIIQNTLRLFAFSAVCFALAISAQASQRTIKVHIPFEFNVGQQTFPAGDYSVSQTLEDVVALKNDRGQTIASAFTHPVQSLNAPEKPVLRFSVSDGQHSLAEVWRPEDGSVGQQLTPIKSRQAVAKRNTVDTDPVTGGTRP